MNVSIVINTLNRACCLQTTLHALQYLDYPHFEVIVVNGPSTDHTEEVLAEYKHKIKVGYCPEKNLSISRNIGIAMAAGEIVAFLDDDAIPEPEWLTTLVSGYDSPEVAAVGGMLYDNSGYTFQSQYPLADRIQGGILQQKDPVKISYFPGSFEFLGMVGANSSFRRSSLLKIGGFDEQYDYFLDETDVCVRLVDAGFTIQNVENCYVHHKFAPSSVRKKGAYINWYPIIKNQIYFMHKNYFTYFDDKPKTLEFLLSFIDKKRKETIWNYDNKKINEEEFKYAMSSIYDGLHHGFIDANHSERKLLSTQTLNQFKQKFKVYPQRFQNKERMVICLVTRTYPPHDYAGIARLTAILAKGLADKGHYVHVICHGTSDINTVDYEEGVWVHAIRRSKLDHIHVPPDSLLPPNRWRSAYAGFEEVMKIKQHHGRVDIVQVPIWDCEGLPFIFDPYFKHRLVTSLHTTMAIESKIYKNLPQDKEAISFRDAMIKAEKFLIKNSAYLYANSNAIIEEVEHLYDLKISAFRHGNTVIPHAVPEVAQFTNLFKLTGMVSNKSVKDPSQYIDILFVGRLQKRKGIDILLECVPDILNQFQLARFFIVGEDSLTNEDGLLYKQFFLEQHAGAHFLDRIIFTGVVSEEELLEYYANCDLFVAPSRFESFGLILIEAMRVAKPVIGCRVGGMKEIVEEGVNGFLVPPENTIELKNAIIDLLKNAEKRNRFGIASRRIYEEKFNTEQMVKKSLNFYQYIASSNGVS